MGMHRRAPNYACVGRGGSGKARLGGEGWSHGLVDPARSKGQRGWDKKAEIQIPASPPL